MVKAFKPFVLLRHGWYFPLTIIDLSIKHSTSCKKIVYIYCDLKGRLLTCGISLKSVGLFCQNKIMLLKLLNKYYKIPKHLREGRVNASSTMRRIFDLMHKLISFLKTCAVLISPRAKQITMSRILTAHKMPETVRQGGVSKKVSSGSQSSTQCGPFVEHIVHKPQQPFSSGFPKIQKHYKIIQLWCGIKLSSQYLSMPHTYVQTFSLLKYII